jgi:hypothetical protein
MENIDIIKTKILPEHKKGLKILVEQFLEKDRGLIVKNSRLFCEQLYGILMKNTIPSDHIHVSDLTDAQLRDAVIEWHRLLSPLWKKFKKYIFDFKENVLPERKGLTTTGNAPIEPSSPLYEYKDLQNNGGYVSMDKLYSLKLRNASTDIGISFDTGRVSIVRDSLNAVNSFIDLIRDVPIDMFAKCGHCKKVIIVGRAGKKYHYGCGAKAIQKAFWKKNKDVAREKENIRYAERRKKCSQA